MSTSRKVDISIIAVSIIFFIFSLLLVHSRPEGVLWSLDEGGKYIYLQSVIQEGKITAPLIYPGRTLDPNLDFIPLYFFVKYGQQAFSWWAYGFPLTTLPFYLSFGWLGLYILPAFCGAISLWLTGKITGHLLNDASWWRLGTAIITGFATPILFYSTMFWEHTIATACILGAIYFLLTLPLNRLWVNSSISGLLIAIAVFYRPESVAVLAGIGFALILCHKYKKSIIFGLSFLVGIIPFVIFNIYTTGGIITPNYGDVQSSDFFSGIQQVGWRFIPRILFNMNREDTFGLSSKLLFIAMILLFFAGISSFFWKRWSKLTYFFLVGLLSICTYILLQPEQYIALHGFITAAPVVLFAMLINPTLGKLEKPIFPWIVILASLSFVGMYILKGWGEAGGLQWGPRYLLVLYPLLILLATYGLSERKKWIINHQIQHENTLLNILFAISIFIGVGFEIRGLVTAHDRMVIYKHSADSIMALPEGPKVTRCSIFAMNVPSLYFKGDFFLERSEEYSWQEQIGGEYDEIQIIPCNNEPINQVREELINNPSGIIVSRINVPPR